MLKIMVTGGMDYITQGVLSELSKSKHEISVVAYKNDPIPSEQIKVYKRKRQEKWEVVSSIKPDVIYVFDELASRKRWKSGMAYSFIYKSHIKLQEVAKANDCEVIYVSSLLLNHAQKDVLSIAKKYVATEKSWHNFISKRENKGKILRTPWVLSNTSWFQQLYLNYISKFKKIPVYGESGNILEIAHIDDISKMVPYYGERLIYGEVYNLLLYPNIPQIEFAKQVGLSFDWEIEQVPFRKSKRLFGREIAEITATSIKLANTGGSKQGYQPIYPTLEDAIKKTLSGIH